MKPSCSQCHQGGLWCYSRLVPFKGITLTTVVRRGFLLVGGGVGTGVLVFLQMFLTFFCGSSVNHQKISLYSREEMLEPLSFVENLPWVNSVQVILL